MSNLEYLAAENPEELVKGLREHLDFPNIRIGARGPLGREMKHDPLERYYNAIEQSDEERKKRIGKALNSILLQEASKTSYGGIHPNLVYNVLLIAQTFPMQELKPALGAFRYMKATLEGALKDKNENLYFQTIMALAENQGDVPLTNLWEELIKSDNEDYNIAAEIGFRKTGWELAVKALPIIAEAKPENLKRAVMLTIDENPEHNWPEGTRELLPQDEQGKMIYGLIEYYSCDRFRG